MTYECFKYTGHVEAKEWIDMDTTNLTKHKTLHAYTCTSVNIIIEKIRIMICSIRIVILRFRMWFTDFTSDFKISVEISRFN